MSDCKCGHPKVRLVDVPQTFRGQIRCSNCGNAISFPLDGGRWNGDLVEDVPDGELKEYRDRVARWRKEALERRCRCTAPGFPAGEYGNVTCGKCGKELRHDRPTGGQHHPELSAFQRLEARVVALEKKVAELEDK